MYPAGSTRTRSRSARLSHVHLIPKIRWRPSDSQRKFQIHHSSESVMSVGSSAASPRRKNRRKSSPNPTRGLLGGRDDRSERRRPNGISVVGFTRTPQRVTDTQQRTRGSARGGSWPVTSRRV